MNVLRDHLTGYINPDLDDLIECFKLLLFTYDVARDAAIDDTSYLSANHRQDALVHVAVLQDSAAVTVDDFTLLGDHVVVLDDTLTNVEVVAFDACLCALDKAR